MRHQRRIGGDHDDDRALVPHGLAPEQIVLQVFSDRSTCDPQLATYTIVSLDERTDDIRALIDLHQARARASAALEFVADHPGTTAHVPFRNRAALSTVEGSEDVLGLHVKSVDVVEVAVIGLGNDG